MYLKNSLIITLLVCALGFVSVQAHTDEPHDADKTPAKKTTQSKKVWSCPMHPEVKGKSKGRCPKCGMDLRLVSEASVSAHEVEMTSGDSARMNIPDVELLDQDGHKIHFY